MRAAFSSFADKLRPGGIAVVFYAGHAVRYAERNYLLPVTADPRTQFDFLTQGMNANILLGVMETADSAANLLILDAAHRNAFTAAGAGAEQGLAEILPSRSQTLVAFATAPGAVTPSGRSQFVAALLQRLLPPSVDLGLAVEEAAAAVRSASGGGQDPWLSGRFPGPVMVGEAVVAAAPEPPAPEPVLPAPVVEEPAVAAVPDEELSAPAPPPAPPVEVPLVPEPVPETPPAALTEPAAPVQAFEEPEPVLEEPAEVAALPQPVAVPADPLAEAMRIEATLSEPELRDIQASLRRLGHYNGAIDADFGPRTRRGISDWQAEAGEEPTGWLTGEQMVELASQAANAPEPEPQPRPAPQPQAAKPQPEVAAVPSTGYEAPSAPAAPAAAGGAFAAIAARAHSPRFDVCRGQPSAEAASACAVGRCGGALCQVAVVAGPGECIAVQRGRYDDDNLGFGKGPTKGAAEDAARRDCGPGACIPMLAECP
jgi:peptidoglycan hydrolase-like protein with peptidoglycan-binding domain